MNQQKQDSKTSESDSDEDFQVILERKVKGPRIRSMTKRHVSIIETIRERMKKVEIFVIAGKLSGEERLASRDLFVRIDSDPIVNTESKSIYSKYFEEMPIFLRNLYQVIGNEKRELQTESGWMVLSLDEFELSATNHKKKGQNAMRMFAHRDQGLGWRSMAYYVVETKKTFITMGGGPNGYDSRQNWENAMAFDPSTLTPDDLLELEELLRLDDEDSEFNTTSLPTVKVDWNAT